MPPVEYLTALAPVAQSVIARMNTGQKVKSDDQMLVLMYSMASDAKESKDEMKNLREDFKRFNDCLHGLTDLVNALRAETAFIRGKIDS